MKNHRWFPKSNFFLQTKNHQWFFKNYLLFLKITGDELKSTGDLQKISSFKGPLFAVKDSIQNQISHEKSDVMIKFNYWWKKNLFHLRLYFVQNVIFFVKSIRYVSENQIDYQFSCVCNMSMFFELLIQKMTNKNVHIPCLKITYIS